MSGNSTAAVLWLMIMLVFLPIAAGHIVARHAAEPPPTASGASQAPGAAQAG